MAASSIDGLYYEFHIPLGLKTLIENLIVSQPARRNGPGLLSGSATNREWFSQPRPATDTTVECITAHFKLPLSVSEIGFDLLRVPCQAEVWYLDRLNNWRQVMDRQRVPISVPVQYSSAASWYTFHKNIYPIVAQAVQIRIQRVADSQLGNSPFVVGLKNTLIRRNVYDRAQGKLPLEDEQDPLGNVISKYVEDWDAAKAIDDKPYTFWKSAPMPDPNAVVNLYLDTRAPDGSGQYMDGIFLDPVYSNQSLNIYYSDDERMGSPRLSPVALRPEDNLLDPPLPNASSSQILAWEDASNDLNTEWRSGKGRWDSSDYPAGKSRYRVRANWGPMISKDAWIGIEWIPDFGASDPPPYNPVLFEVNPITRTASQFAPSVYYDSGSGSIALKLYDGITTKTYSVALSPLLVAAEPLRIVVGWSYAPDKVYISVKDRQGNQLALYDRIVPNTSPTAPALPTNVTFDGLVGFSNFRGTFTSHIVKQQNHSGQGELFQDNPMMYVDPDPVMPNSDGSIPSTSLDSAMFAVDWTLQPQAFGGQHESFYTDKRWTPIWRDYITRRGKMLFPQAISAKYLKLEFTGLTEESYPVYDAGIEVTYQVFPVAVNQSQTVNHPGLRGVAAKQLVTGVRATAGVLSAINWLNPQTVANAINSTFGPVSNPVTISTGGSYTASAIPGTAEAPLSDTTRTEMSSPYVYRRGLLDPRSLASNHIYYSGFTTWQQTLSNAHGLIHDAIVDSFAPVREYRANPNLGPVQGEDFWLFPGATLKMPASVLNGITARHQTRTGRKPSTENRMRFNTESVHRYETRTVARDAAVAYFAGVREVQPLITTYLNRQDPVIFTFDNYTAAQGWGGLDSTRLVQDRVTLTTLASGDKISVGPLSTKGRIYEIVDADFDQGIDNWEVKSGTWAWDNTPLNGRWYPGTAKATATGTKSELWSTFITSYPEADLEAGRQITVNVYTKWSGLAVTNNQPGIQLGVATYNEGALVADDIVLGQISYSNWSSNANKGYTLISTTWTVPSGVDDARLRLIVTNHASSGSVWFDSITFSSPNEVSAAVYQTFTTVSNFAKLRCKFFDSDIVRSDSMWARLQEYTDWIDYDKADSPDNFPGGKKGVHPTYAPAINEDGTPYSFPYTDQRAYVLKRISEIRNQGGVATEEHYKIPQWSDWNGIDSTALAYYTSLISLDLFDNNGVPRAGGANWADPIAVWGVTPGAPEVTTGAAWGSLNALVNITIHPDRIYDGKRVLHFSREAGAGEVGVRVRQWNNFVPNALFRICARWLKPRKNDNSITVRLRRVSDGVVVYQEEVRTPAVGYWHEFATSFQRVPAETDQVYTVELVTSGDSEDELYLSDLWVELSHVRYFITLGPSGTPQDVTDLRYADTAIVSCSVPVNEFTVEARIYTPRASITGCQIQPTYLK